MSLPATTFVIFGATGDLTRHKLAPSLFHLHETGRLPEDFRLVGAARSPLSDEAFRARLRDGVARHDQPPDPDAWTAFAERVSYVQGDATDDGDMARLVQRLAALEDDDAQRVYHLATLPRLYEPIVRALGAHGRADGAGRRIVVEKPFGRDLETARHLNRALHASFAEHDVFRIDHYLGKETAQNILFFRFANTVFEPVWNRNYIDHVQITVAESLNVAQRGAYYDDTGVVRDMFQNHLLQLVALVAMEPPNSFDADAVRDEKVKLLQAVRCLDPDEIATKTVRGQYEGYRGTEGVAPDSATATFAALRLDVRNWRWQGVPFYLRSAKAMAEKATEIVVSFRLPAAPPVSAARRPGAVEQHDCAVHPAARGHSPAVRGQGAREPRRNPLRGHGIPLRGRLRRRRRA